MAATVSIAGTPGLTLVDTADTVTGWSGTSGQQDLEVKVQGNASYTYQTGKNSREACTFTPAASIDMSAGGTHLYWWMQCAVFPFCELKSTGTTTASGLTVRIESSATDFEEWHVAGSDTWGGEWKCFCIDINHSGTERYATGGTISRSAITKITWYTDNSNSGQIRIIDNTWIDVVRFGTGLIAYGTTFDYADIEAIDQNSSNMYGIIQEKGGVYMIQGGITIDDNSGTTTFDSTNEVLVFRDIPVGSNLYKLGFTGLGTTIVFKGISVLSSGSIESTRFDIAAPVGTIFDMDVSGSKFDRGGLVTIEAGDVTNTVFNNVGRVTVANSSQDITISNGLITTGTLYYRSVKNITFINNVCGVFYEGFIDVTFDNFIFDDVSGHYDIYSSNAITVTKTNGSNPNSYEPTGEVVTFTAAFDHILTDMIENTEVTYVKQSDTSVLYHVENVTATGTTTYTHAGGDVVDIMIFHIDKLPDISSVYDLTLPNSNASIKIAQFDDPDYFNP